MLDDLYQTGTDAALNDLAARPLPQAQSSPKFSAWRVLKAVPRGAAQGANESAGFFADALKAFGTIQASQLDSDPVAQAVLPADQLRQGAAEATKQLQTGEAFTSQMGEDFRATARDFMPDPQTAHVAERTVQGLARFATKAIGYSGAGPAGPVLLGADEANQTAADLAAQGVDPETRAKAAALAGASAAAAMVLPVAGSTVKSTVALTAVGGPGAFIAQTAATRQILQSAGYDQLAATYDPFDPVGLAVATLVPAGFGAWAMRGAKLRAAGEAPPAEVRPGETAPAAEHVAPEVVHPTSEHVDAARVELLTQHVEDARLTPPDDVIGARAHTESMTSAMDQMAAGERVQVTDVAPILPTAAPPSGVDFKTGADGFVSANTEAGTVGGHVRGDALHITFAEVAKESQGKGEGVRLYSALVDKALSEGLRVFSDSTVEASAVRVYESLKRRGYDVRRLDGGEIDGAAYGKGAKAPAFEIAAGPKRQPDAPAGRQSFDAWVKQLGEIANKTSAAAPKEPANVQDAAPKAKPAAPDQVQPAAEPTPANARSNGAAGGEGAAAAEPGRAAADSQAAGVGPGAVAESAAQASRLADVAKQFPDLEVMLDGMDAPAKLSDFLAEVERVAMDGTDFELGAKDAPLMQMAAQCFLLNGG